MANTFAGGTLDQAKSGLNSWTQQQYGQTLNDSQFQQLGGMLGYQGGDVSADMYGQAQNLIGQYAGQLGWSPVQSPQAAQPAPAAPAPTQAGPDQQGIAQFQSWAQQQYGRPATEAELGQIASQIGYTGGTITPQIMQQAQQAAAQIAQQQGAPAPQAPQAPAQPPPVTTQQVQQAGNQQLIRLLTGDTDTVDPNSAAMRTQRGAFQRQQQRGIERARLAAAERANATGATGALDADVNQINLAAAEQAGNFEAGLIGQELQGQRERLMQALALAQQAGMAQEARQLQERLAGVDAQIRREGLTLQGQLGRGQLGLGYLNAMLNDRQANNALGFNYAQLQNAMNNQALSSLLAGLN